MTSDIVIQGPSSEELVYLLEKQDTILESLMGEMEMCKVQIEHLKRSEQVQAKESMESQTAILDSQKKLTDAVKAMEEMQNQNTRLEREVDRLRNSVAVQPVNSVLEMREKMREINFEVEREKRATETLKTELEREKMKNEELRREIEMSTKARKELTNSLNARIEAQSKELADAQFRLEALSSQSTESSAKVSSQVEILTQRESFLEGYCKQLSGELAVLRKERSIITSRIAAITEENASLRTRMMKNTLNDNNREVDADEQMQKLIDDQCHLISALKEECQLLTDKLESERAEQRSKLKAAKREKKELENRLQKLLEV